MAQTTNVPVLYVNRDILLPDNDQWQFRMEVKSETSDRIYIVSQNKKKKHWGCSCPGYRIHRTCKHLEAMGLPAKEQPYDPKIIQH